MVDPNELAHYKRESLVLAIALRKATDMIAVCDSAMSEQIFIYLIDKAREQISPMNNCCIDQLLIEHSQNDN